MMMWICRDRWTSIVKQVRKTSQGEMVLHREHIPTRTGKENRILTQAAVGFGTPMVALRLKCPSDLQRLKRVEWQG